MAGPSINWLSLRGMAADESSDQGRDLVVPHTTAQSHDTNGRAGQSSNMEERLSFPTQRKNKRSREYAQQMRLMRQKHGPFWFYE